MPWYVFALLDAAPPRSPGRGLAAPVTVRRAGAFFAAVERRADTPPLEFGSLRMHQQVVERIASNARAILPVRFGTLLESGEIDDALDEREEELREAFTFVRGRRQMTWRSRKGRTTASGTRSARVKPSAMSGAEYLRHVARAEGPPPTGVLRRVADSLGRLAAAERYQRASPTLPDALYHLVDDTRLDAYTAASKQLKTAASSATLSGPWAPYAFAPELF